MIDDINQTESPHQQPGRAGTGLHVGAQFDRPQKASAPLFDKGKMGPQQASIGRNMKKGADQRHVPLLPLPITSFT